MDVKAKLESLLGREIHTLPVNYKNKQGFVPEYFDFADRNNVSALFSETEDGALENLLAHIEGKTSGGTDGTDTKS